MSQDSALREAVNLTMEAEKLNMAGDMQEALKRMDEAIAVAESANVPAFQFRIKRELIRLGNSPDHSTLIPILEESLNYYKLRGEVLEQVDALLNLSGIQYHMKDYQQALHYLDQAASIIGALTESQINDLNEYSQIRNVSMYALLQLRTDEITRRRIFITNLRNLR